MFFLVSYPDPNVRNDDYRLQYNITYRGSGQQVSSSPGPIFILKLAGTKNSPANFNIKKGLGTRLANKSIDWCAGMLALQSESRVCVTSR